MLFGEQDRVGGTVFINGVKRSVSRGLVNFFRTYSCRIEQPKVSDQLTHVRYDAEAERRRVTATCPVHGDKDFLISELCLDIAHGIQTMDRQNIWRWIKVSVETHDIQDISHSRAYAPLQTGEIRLLRFFPLQLHRKGHEDVPMATITHKLDNPPKFAALSYCWG